MKRAGWLWATLAAIAIAAGFVIYFDGSQPGTASEDPVMPSTSSAAAPEPQIDPKKELDSISPAIPVYSGASYRADLSRRDLAMVRNQYGPDAQVYTLASDDSFPQIWHYYVNYLAQFRAFEAQEPYPPHNQNWRTIEIPLHVVMQDPFIPGESLQGRPERVILQIAETEAEPTTVIRYIVQKSPATAPSQPAVAAAPAPNAPVAR